jgi:hypothetical protein
MPADDELISNTIRELVNRCFYRNLHYHGVMHCGLNPYLTMQVAQCLVRMRDPYALTMFESLMSMATQTFTFPEAINPLTGGGSFGDGHHGWSASEIFNLVRNLLLLEEGDTLTILPLGKPDWFEPGRGIEVKRAPTFFGEVGYEVNCAEETVSFELPGEMERPPRALELNTPLEILSARVDGEMTEVAPGSRALRVSPSAKEAILEVRRVV